MYSVFSTGFFFPDVPPSPRSTDLRAMQHSFITKHLYEPNEKNGESCFIKYKMFQNARSVVGLGCHEREFVLRGIKDFNTFRYCA